VGTAAPTAAGAGAEVAAGGIAAAGIGDGGGVVAAGRRGLGSPGRNSGPFCPQAANNATARVATAARSGRPGRIDTLARNARRVISKF
jgi:hypothetical protein